MEDSKKYYIRFGGVPNDEISMAWTADGEIKHAEVGTSVYNAICIDNHWQLVIPHPLTEKMLNTLYSLVFYKQRQVYLVEGDEVGRGSDNEPCLRNVKVVKNITDDFKIYKEKSAC